MKIKSILWMCFIALTSNVIAQAPDVINYQAIVRDVNNTVIANQAVSVKFVITEGLPTGTVIYEENQSPTTNSHGLINLKIGTGAFVVGTLAAIDWSANSYYLTTSIDPTGGSNYSLSGVSELVSVPYALHAKTVDDKDDADADPTNEIELPTGGTTGQVLETDGSGNYTWVNQAVDTDTQLDETAVDAFVANNGYLTTELDADPTNEIELPTGGTNGQVLKTDGAGNYAWVNQTVDTDTDTQLDETAVDAFVANNGYLTAELDADPTNEIELPTGGTNGQVLETDGSGNYTWVNQTVDTDTDTQLNETAVDAFVSNNGYLTTEVDGSVTNEIQTLSLSGSDLTISGTGGNTVTLPSASAPTFAVGMHHLGGIIVFVDSTGSHGLIASISDLGTTSKFENGTNTNVTAAQSYVNGQANTTALLGAGGNFDAAALCNAYAVGAPAGTWYLPSLAETQLIFQNAYVMLNLDLGAIYWTSTQTPGSFGFNAVSYYGAGSSNGSTNPNTAVKVRAMRQF